MKYMVKIMRLFKFQIFIIFFILFFLNENLSAEEINNIEKTIIQSIEKLKNKDINNLYAPGKNKQKEEVEKAKALILEYKEISLSLLKKQAENILSSDKKDYIFLQEASNLIWQITGESDVDYIFSIWKKIPYEEQSNGVYFTAFEMAKKRNEKYLPLIKYLLGNEKGSYFTKDKGIHIRWPTTIKILWSVYGYESMPELIEILKSPLESIEAKKSSILILTQAQYLPALPLIRSYATNVNNTLKESAICSLGIFGHPDDFDILVEDFDKVDGSELWARAFALFEFEDLRAVPFLINKLSTKYDEARFEVLSALSHLYSKESITSIIEYCKNPKNKREEKFCFYYSINFEKDTKTKLDSFLKLNDKEKDDIVFGLIEGKNNRYKISANNKNFSRDDFLKLKLHWEKNEEILPAGYENIKIGDLINIMSEEDIPILYSTISKIYDNLKEESFADINTLEQIIKYLSRKRYRSEIALTNIAKIK